MVTAGTSAVVRCVHGLVGAYKLIWGRRLVGYFFLLCVWSGGPFWEGAFMADTDIDVEGQRETFD